MAIRLCLMLMFGASMSILIALSCALLQNDASNWTWGQDRLDSPATHRWFWSTPANWPKEPNDYTWTRSFGYEAGILSSVLQGNDMLILGVLPTYEQTRYAAGFPFSALEARHESGTGAVAKALLGRFAFFGWERGASYTPSATAPFYGIVPLMPYWPGLLFDAALYGIGLGSVILWLSGLRRRGRVRRGECVSCGYAVEGLPKCPECGAVATSRAPGPPPPAPSPAHPPA